MAWIATDKDGEIYIYTLKPTRANVVWEHEEEGVTQLGRGVANILTNHNIPKWEDEPVQIGIIDG